VVLATQLMAEPADWQDPPWIPDDSGHYDWRWFVAPNTQAE
jgi:hypothetical protein